mgnify:CR=1 FL=1
MGEFDWKKFIGGVAPALGTALGGPLAGAAVSALAASLLGNDAATEADLTAALSTGQITGEQMAAIKQAEFNFQAKMRELEIDVLKVNQAAEDAYLKDVQDARARQVATKDAMPQVIFFLLLALYAAEFALFYFGKMPDDEFVRALITRAFSTIEVGFTGAIAYFIGSSRGSKVSGDAVREIAQKTAKPS